MKARSSSLGRRPFFFSCQDEKLNAAETRASVAEARVLVLEREKARPFFFSGLGGTRKPVLQVDLMKEIASQARFSSFFSPLFGGVFPGQATRVAGLAGRESLDAGLPFPLFPPPPALPLGFAFVPGLRGAAFEAWPWPRTPSPSFSPFFFRSIPRRSVSPGRPSPSTSASTWKKRSGPRPFFFVVFPVPSGHLGVPCRAGTVPSGHLGKRAERALWIRSRQCRAGTLG